MTVRPRALGCALLVGTLILATLALARPSGADRQSVYDRIDTSAEAYLRYSLGRLMEVRGLLSDALVQYRGVASLDPGHPEVDTAVARVLLAMGRSAEAERKIDAALVKCADDVEAIALKAQILLTEDRLEEAIELLEPRVRTSDAPREFVALLGQALLSSGLIDEAQALYGERCNSDSLAPSLAYFHARVLLAGDKPEEAVAELRRANRLDPDNRATRTMLARLLPAVGRPAEAVPMLELLVAEGGSREPEYDALARCYSDLGRHDQAIKTAEAAITRFGETPQLLRTLGSVQFRAGLTQEALATYDKALALDPNSVRTLNFLAYTLAEENLDLERALTLALRAVEQEPDNGLVRDTLGWTYFKLRRFGEAREEIQRAVDLGEEDAVILEHLGDTLQALGLADEALEAWTRALKIEPGRESSAERVRRVAAEQADGP